VYRFFLFLIRRGCSFFALSKLLFWSVARSETWVSMLLEADPLPIVRTSVELAVYFFEQVKMLLCFYLPRARKAKEQALSSSSPESELSLSEILAKTLSLLVLKIEFKSCGAFAAFITELSVDV
jgi:hypothetical protein